jgi:MFS family permease
VPRTLPLAVFFTVDGFLFASWVVRVPQVKAHVHATAGQLGLALFCMSVGGLLAMPAAGRLCARLGTHRVVRVVLPAICLLFVLPTLVGSTPLLGAVLFLLGLWYGTANVALNSAASEVETRTGRAVMPTLHGLWSLGNLAGALLGGLLADHLSPPAHLALAATLALATSIPAAIRLSPRTATEPPTTATGSPATGAAGSPATDPAATGSAVTYPAATGGPVTGAVGSGGPVGPGGAGRRRPAVGAGALVLVGFGAVALCTAYGEGAIGDWSTLHLRADLGAGAGLAAYGFAAYSVAATAARLVGGWLIARFGRTAVLVVGSLLAAAVVLTAALVALAVPPGWRLAVAFVGLVAVGLGLANVFPIAIGRAGALGGPRGVALAATIGYTGQLAGPPFIGLLADHTGLPWALTTIAALSLAAAALGWWLRNTAPAPAPAAAAPQPSLAPAGD